MQVQPISQTKQANQPLPEPIVDVKSFCARFENNIWLDIPFLDMYFRTAFKNMSALGDAYQKELNRETERVLRYFDRLIEEEAKKAKAQARAQAKKQAKKEETQTRVKRGGVLDWDSEERLPSIPEAQESVPEQPEPLPEPKKDAKTRTATTKSTTASAPLAKYRKFAVKRNCKEPACTWSDQSNWTKTPFDPSFRNTGIPTGPANNLLVVDLDVKDDGVLEFQNYISEHGNPKTLTVRTPSGGYHYYFNYSSANPDDNILIKAFLKNASKYRGKGVDVRSAGGYVVGPPSRRDGKSYTILNETAPIDIPSSLISWLLVGKAPVVKEKRGKKEVTRELAPNTYQYDLTEEQIKNILAMLPEKFLNNYSDWLLATTVLKFHGQRDIWEEWSKQSPSYNKTKNDEQWNYNKGFLDINYLVWVLRKAGEEIEFVTRFKPYTPIAKDISQVKQKSFNKAFVSEGFSYKAFEKHETIIIKSCTGTGKTTAVAQHVKQYMKQASGAKFLSITTRTSLSDQHQKSFEELGMRNYQDVRANFGDIESLTICLNSLAKLGDLDEDELKDYIVYIDEVSSFLEFTHNDTLDSILKQTFVLISRLAKFAGKVIVSDALINDNTFEFLKHRRPEATLMLTNGFKKFKDVPAVRLRSEPAFLEKLIEHCNANQPFLFKV